MSETDVTALVPVGAGVVTVPGAAAAAAAAGTGCTSCAAGDGEYPYVYALGEIRFEFPNTGVEREFYQANRQTDSKGQTDEERFHAALALPQNRYLVRQLCWVMSISRVDTYLLQPPHGDLLDVLVDALRPAADPNDRALDLVVGIRGPVAPPDYCAGLMLPIVRVDQLYSFAQRDLIGAIPRPKDAAKPQFDRTAADLFANRILQFTDNAGSTDEHRALNYLAVRVPEIYALAVERQNANHSLDRIDVLPSRMSGSRRLVNVVFVYKDRATTVETKYRVRVDVTEEFPFVDLALSPYYDR